MRSQGLFVAILTSAAIVVSGGFVRVLAADAKAPEKTEPTATSKVDPAESGRLAAQQQQVAGRFLELEKLLLRMAELTAPTDPRRAALLRQAVAQSKQRDIDHQFEQLVELLKEERLSLVVKNQGQVQQDLNRLLELLLSEDRSKRIESEKERIREYLKRVNKIIKEQKGIQGETARQGDPRQLAERQGDLGDKTGELADDLAKDAQKKSHTPDAPKDGDQEKSPKDNEGEQKDGKSKGGKDTGDSDKKKSDDSGKEKSGDKKSDDDKAGGKKNDGKKDDEKDKETKGDDKPKDGKSGDPSKSGDKDGKPDDKSGQPDKGDDQKSDGKSGGKPQDQPPMPGQEGQGGESGEQSDEPPPSDNPAQQRLKKAQERMKEAQRKLEEAKKSDAAEKQTEAIKELEQAKADLEEILRQLREEEMARMLAMLEARFRKMLDAQVEVYEGTRRLDNVQQAQRDRDDEIEAGRLSRKEALIAAEADKALAVLREEGSAVAFPEAVMEMRDDMEQVVGQLSQAKVGEVTQGVEKDIIAALEEMIASLKKAQKDMEEKSKQGEPAPSGEDEPPLVDTLAELKMIRALQMRVNVRTQRYAEMTKTEQTEAPELLKALKTLAEREQRIHKVTRDIVVGRNR